VVSKIGADHVAKQKKEIVLTLHKDLFTLVAKDPTKSRHNRLTIKRGHWDLSETEKPAKFSTKTEKP